MPLWSSPLSSTALVSFPADVHVGQVVSSLLASITVLLLTLMVVIVDLSKKKIVLGRFTQ